MKATENAVAKTESGKDKSSTREFRIEHFKSMMLEKGRRVIDEKEAEKLGFGLLMGWLGEISRFGSIKRTMLIMEDVKDNHLVVKFYTSDNEYSIVARKGGYSPSGAPEDWEYGYLGCIANSRRNRVGEFWARGSDLPDGDYRRETFASIMKAIVSYEIKNLQCFD